MIHIDKIHDIVLVQFQSQFQSATETCDDIFNENFDEWIKGRPTKRKKMQILPYNYYLVHRGSWKLKKGGVCKIYYSRNNTYSNSSSYDKVIFLLFEHCYDNTIYHFKYLLKYVTAEGKCLLDKYKKLPYSVDLLEDRFKYRGNKILHSKKIKTKRINNKTKTKKMTCKKTKGIITSNGPSESICTEISDMNIDVNVSYDPSEIFEDQTVHKNQLLSKNNFDLDLPEDNFSETYEICSFFCDPFSTIPNEEVILNDTPTTSTDMVPVIINNYTNL